MANKTKDPVYEAGKKRLLMVEIVIVAVFSAIAIYCMYIGKVP